MSLKQIADELAARGRYGDSELVHMSKGEVAGLQQLAESAGGSLTINPDTGKPEAFFLAALLPSLLGAAAPALGAAATGAGLTGLGGLLGSKFGAAGLGALAGGLMNRKDPLMGALMGGLGGFGGFGLGSALQGAGVGAAQQAAMQAAPQLAQSAVGQGINAATSAGMNIAAPMASQGLKATAGTGLNLAAPVAEGARLGVSAPQLLGETAARNTLAAQATQNALAQPYYTQMGQGIKALGTEAGRTTAMQALGGPGGALSTAGMAAAPLMTPGMTGRRTKSTPEDEGSIPEYDYTAQMTGDYYQPGQATYERRYFTDPTFTRRAAEGGIMQLARGGALALQDGDFIVPADVTAFAGGGSTDAGMKVLAKKIGAQPIKGPGTGLSDDIPARIDGKQPARVANGEMLVRKPGKEGAKKLYAMMDNIRKQATGKKKQIRPVNVDKALA
jgi:hypothetical protein